MIFWAENAIFGPKFQLKNGKESAGSGMRKQRHKLYFFAGLATGALLMTAGMAMMQNAARAQETAPRESSDIQVVPVQVGRTGYGVAMVDVNLQKIWVYEINRDAPSSQLRLLAARDFRYDRLLTEYNTGQPTPTQVRDILEKLLQRQQEE